jgi:hypothetical protein
MLVETVGAGFKQLTLFELVKSQTNSQFPIRNSQLQTVGA